MTKQGDYLRRAEEMRRLAEQEPSAQVRADLLRMAHGWDAMARRRARLDATLTTEPKSESES